MKGYLNKKSILEAMGKDGKDVRYLDRALSSGKVIMMGGRYYLLKDYIEWCWEEEEASKKEIESLKNKIDELENQLENASGSIDYSDVLHRIYVYLREVLHINVDYNDLVDFVENYPSE